MKREWLDEILEADLFMFQYRDREKRFAGIGNWFIVAKPYGLDLTKTGKMVRQVHQPVGKKEVFDLKKEFPSGKLLLYRIAI